MIIPLQFCTVEFTDWGCITRFQDGAEAPSVPHPDDPHYREITRRCGYGDDVMAYAREHDAIHSFLIERVKGKPSPVIWAAAHPPVLSGADSFEEEMAVQGFQAWLRADVEPIIAGVNWHGLKREALELLAS